MGIGRERRPDGDIAIADPHSITERGVIADPPSVIVTEPNRTREQERLDPVSFCRVRVQRNWPRVRRDIAIMCLTYASSRVRIITNGVGWGKGSGTCTLTNRMLRDDGRNGEDRTATVARALQPSSGVNSKLSGAAS